MAQKKSKPTKDPATKPTIATGLDQLAPAEELDPLEHPEGITDRDAIIKHRFAKPIQQTELEKLDAEQKAEISRLSKKHKSLGSALREIGNFTDPQTGYTMQFAMCYNAFIAAVGGDKSARDWVSDRTEGKAVQRKIIQNMDVITRVMEILERVISDPLPKTAGDLKRMLAYEFEKLANEGDAAYDI